MLPRVSGSLPLVTRWLLAAMLGGLVACGDDEAAPSEPAAAARAEGEPSWAERLAEPDVSGLLAALDQPHATIREAVGAHHLQVTTQTSLTPPAWDPEALHPVDAPVVPDQAVRDELALTWRPAEDGEERLSLSQHNDHDRGRDVIVIGETVHVRKEHRGWYHYARDSDLVELWLDDAQRSVHDAIELAAPRLALRAQTVEGGGLRGGDAVEITLDLAESVTPALAAAGPTQGWRREAELTGIEGTLRLDATTGAWLSAELDLRYRLSGADGRPLEGRLRLEGQVTPDPAQDVSAPTDSRPLPTRIRYDQEQQELLDGLAAP